MVNFLLCTDDGTLVLYTMSKTFFIIPGFKAQTTDASYQWLVSFLKKNEFSVRLVPVTWTRRTVTQNAEEFLRYFDMHKTEENYILGFSYGAVIALMTAQYTQPNVLYLCSLSPDFAEDVHTMPAWLRSYIGKRRFADAGTRSAVKLAQALTVKTFIFQGEKEEIEYPPLKKRGEKTAQLAKHATLIRVPDAPHQIDYPTYQEAIKKYLPVR